MPQRFCPTFDQFVASLIAEVRLASGLQLVF